MSINSDACSFCRIATGITKATTVLDDAHCLAFLDHRPLFPGHCLLIPKAHVLTLADLPDDLTEPLFADARILARAVVLGLRADGSFVAINNGVSQSVPHLHVHVVPRRHGDGLRGFFWPRQHYAYEEEAEETATAIRDAIELIRIGTQESNRG
jgi:histidine triad (HIT) family protein